MKKKIIGYVIMIPLALGVGFGIGNHTEHRISQTEQAVVEAHARDMAVRRGQIQNCHIIGDPLREAVIDNGFAAIEGIQDQIAQSKITNYSRLFPDYPRDELRALIRTNNERLHEQIATRYAAIKPLLNVPSCERRYPPLRQSP